MVKQGELSPELAAILDSLRAWTLTSGTYTNHVQIEARQPGNRALFATENLEAGAPFLRIPPSLLITCKTSRQAPHVSAVLQAVERSRLSDRIPDATSDSAALLLFVLAEFVKGQASFWFPWFRSLPTEFHTPFTISEDDLNDTLSGTTLLTLATTLREELREMYDEWFVPFASNAYPDIYPADKCDYKTFVYIHSVIDSRAFKIDNLTILAPFADMANHRALTSPARNAKVRGWALDETPEQLGLEMHVCDSPVVKGDELCISYGALPNWQLLLHYGFAIPHNPEDSILLSLQVPEDDSAELHTRKMLFLNMNLQGNLDVNHELRMSDPLPAWLLASARLLLLNDEEAGRLTVQNANFTERISMRNERAVIASLMALVESMLSGFDLFEDGDGDGGDRGSIEWFCQVYVNGQAAILGKSLEALKDISATIHTT